MTGIEIAIFAAIAAGTVSAVASHQQGKAQERSAKASAEFNAAKARQDAEQKTAAGKLAADRIRRQRIRLTKSQTAEFASRGVTEEGTPIKFKIQSAAEEELNANLTQHNFEIGAAASISEARVFDFKKGQASAFKRAGNINAGASLLGGIAQAGLIKAAS